MTICSLWAKWDLANRTFPETFTQNEIFSSFNLATPFPLSEIFPNFALLFNNAP